MPLGSEIKRFDLKMVEGESLAKLLRRWAARLVRLVAKARGDRCA